jgi:hypothetical protein
VIDKTWQLKLGFQIIFKEIGKCLMHAYILSENSAHKAEYIA